jgi:hypothetical protein
MKRYKYLVLLVLAIHLNVGCYSPPEPPRLQDETRNALLPPMDMQAVARSVIMLQMASQIEMPKACGLLPEYQGL